MPRDPVKRGAYMHKYKRTEKYKASRRKANMSPEKWADILARGAASRRNNPKKTEWNRRADLKKYDKNLTPEVWNSMFEAQGRRCANLGCRSESPNRKDGKWCTDHDHKTGKVRGILCQYCNVMLGQAQDDPSRLIGGAKYLEERK